MIGKHKFYIDLYPNVANWLGIEEVAGEDYSSLDGVSFEYSSYWLVDWEVINSQSFPLLPPFYVLNNQMVKELDFINNAQQAIYLYHHISCFCQFSVIEGTTICEYIIRNKRYFASGTTLSEAITIASIDLLLEEFSILIKSETKTFMESIEEYYAYKNK